MNGSRQKQPKGKGKGGGAIKIAPKSQNSKPKPNARWFFNAENVGFGSSEGPRRSKPGRAVEASENKGQLISQDEYIGTVNGNTGFGATATPVNCGDPALFPWCSQLSAMYTKWRVRKMRFYVKPAVSGYSTDGQKGKVVLAFDYNALSAPMANLQDAMSMTPHADAMPYETVSLSLDPDRCTGDGKFIRYPDQAVKGDLKTYDAGLLSVCVAGTSNANLIGELHVEYTIELFNPRLTTETAPVINDSYAMYAYTANLTGLVSGTPTVVVPPLSGVDGIGVAVTANGYQPPRGNYLILVQLLGYSPTTVLLSCALNLYQNGNLVPGCGASFVGNAFETYIGVHTSATLALAEGDEISIKVTNTTSGAVVSQLAFAGTSVKFIEI